MGPVRSHGIPQDLTFLVFIYYRHPQIGPAVEIPQVHFTPLGRKQTAPSKEQVLMVKGNLGNKYKLIHRLI